MLNTRLITGETYEVYATSHGWKTLTYVCTRYVYRFYMLELVFKDGEGNNVVYDCMIIKEVKSHADYNYLGEEK